jgi:DNA-binding LacI/PurR family transcriptional regulator
MTYTISDIVGTQTDGMVFCFPDDYVDIDTLLSTNDIKIPFVLISWDMHNSKYASIIVDVYDGMYDAASHHIKQGHKKLAFIGGPEDSRISGEKFRGFLKAAHENNIDVSGEYISSGDYSLKTGYTSARRFLQLDDPPTAILCANDMLAIGCLKYLLNSGIKVPEKVSVSGFDNISIASMYEPALTTVAIPVDEISRACAEMITGLVDRKEKKNKSLIFKTKLVIRSSTDINAPIEL